MVEGGRDWGSFSIRREKTLSVYYILNTLGLNTSHREPGDRPVRQYKTRQPVYDSPL